MNAVKAVNGSAYGMEANEPTTDQTGVRQASATVGQRVPDGSPAAETPAMSDRGAGSQLLLAAIGG